MRLRHYSYLLLIIFVIGMLFIPGCFYGDSAGSGPWIWDDNIQTGGSFIRRDGYWHEYVISAFATSPGSSGATRIDTDANTLGGYILNAAGDYLEFSTHVDTDYTASTTGYMDVFFEVNVDNSGGAAGDIAAFTLECNHKHLGDTATTMNTHTGNVTVGASPQYKLYEVEIAVDDLTLGQVITFQLFLDTVNSDIGNVIINYIEFKYETIYPGVEIP